ADIITRSKPERRNNIKEHPGYLPVCGFRYSPRCNHCYAATDGLYTKQGSWVLEGGAPGIADRRQVRPTPQRTDQGRTPEAVAGSCSFRLFRFTRNHEMGHVNPLQWSCCQPNQPTDGI